MLISCADVAGQEMATGRDPRADSGFDPDTAFEAYQPSAFEAAEQELMFQDQQAEMVQLLLRRLGGEETESLVLPPQLVIRHSA